MSSDQIVGYVIALGLGAILLEFVRSFLQRKQMGASAAKTITEAATSLLSPLQARIVELEAKLAAANATLETTLERLEQATREVESLRERMIERENRAYARDEAREQRAVEREDRLNGDS